jgi:hypothetical protein
VHCWLLWRGTFGGRAKVNEYEDHIALLGNVWRGERRDTIVCAGLSFSLPASTSGSVRFGPSIIPSRLSFLDQPLAILRNRQSLLNDVSCIAEPWVWVHAKDARNHGISIEAGLEVHLALCGLEGLTPMGRSFWAWKAPNFGDGHQQDWCRNSPVHGYKAPQG